MRRIMTKRPLMTFILTLLAVVGASPMWAQEAGGHSEIDLVLPDLSQVLMMGTSGRSLLMGGLLVCIGGLGFGLWIYSQLKNMPVHKSMLEISELIYETC